MSGWDIYGNVFSNASQGVLLGGGRRNQIHDNLFLSNNVDVAFDNRGMNWQSTFCQFNCSASLGTSCARLALEAVRYQSPPWSVVFPEVVDIYKDHPCVPVGNIIEDNFYCHKNSPPGTTPSFLNRNASVIKSWLSMNSNNVENCDHVDNPSQWLLNQVARLQKWKLCFLHAGCHHHFLVIFFNLVMIWTDLYTYKYINWPELQKKRDLTTRVLLRHATASRLFPTLRDLLPLCHRTFHGYHTRLRLSAFASAAYVRRAK